MTEIYQTTWDGLPIANKAPYGAAIVVFQRRPEGIHYLVLHRSHEGPAYEGDWAWGHPAGCRLPGEPLEACAARELREETGLALPCQLLTSATADWPVFIAEAPVRVAVSLSAEHDRYRWLPARAAAAITLPGHVGEQILLAARHLDDPAMAEAETCPR